MLPLPSSSADDFFVTIGTAEDNEWLHIRHSAEGRGNLWLHRTTNVGHGRDKKRQKMRKPLEFSAAPLGRPGLMGMMG
ncbi:Hypothetical protein NTJ_13494 [Nesidiocoris tenuis]|uniref:MIR domain-containing protein n=1 Tax=Nesidiocoris tenuis TaxID=355587 RepID=A0ABN7B8H0_9HEMI|nr:Hypothetical protein NTJ_13494 [Nesidiocoris tenuis]